MNLITSVKGDSNGKTRSPVARTASYILITILVAFLVSTAICVTGTAVSDPGDPGAGIAAQEKLYAVDSGGGNISVINVGSGQVIRNIEFESSPELHSIAKVPGRSRAYVTDTYGNAVHVIDTSTDNVIGAIKVGKNPKRITVDRDGRQAFVINNGNRSVNGTISVIDTGKDLVVSTIRLEGASPEKLVLSPDGTRAYVATDTNEIYVMDTGTGTVTDKITDLPDVLGVSPDGSRLYAIAYGAGPGENDLVAIDMLNKTRVTSLPVGQYMVSAISPDSSRIYLSGDRTGPDNKVKVIDTSRNAIAAVITMNESPMISARFHVLDIVVSPDGDKVYVTNHDDDYIRVIDTATNAEITKIPVGWGHVGVAVV